MSLKFEYLFQKISFKILDSVAVVKLETNLVTDSPLSKEKASFLSLSSFCSIVKRWLNHTLRNSLRIVADELRKNDGPQRPENIRCRTSSGKEWTKTLKRKTDPVLPECLTYRKTKMGFHFPFSIIFETKIRFIVTRTLICIKENCRAKMQIIVPYKNLLSELMFFTTMQSTFKIFPYFLYFFCCVSWQFIYEWR